MGERKVQNKYYPAKIPRRRPAKNHQKEPRIMLPMNIRCRTCGNFMYSSTKFNSRQENAVGKTYLGIQIFRFYFKCTTCSAEITLVTNPQNSDYTVESGASRNFEPRHVEEEIEEGRKKRKGEEMGDALKSLENRTLDSKRDIDIVAALDELRSMKSRRETVSVDAMLEAMQKSNQQKERKLLEEEAYIRAVFRVRKNRKIDDDDLESECASPPLKRSKVVEEVVPCKAAVLKSKLCIMKKSSTATAKDKEEKDGLQSLMQQYAETADFY